MKKYIPTYGPDGRVTHWHFGDEYIRANANPLVVRDVNGVPKAWMHRIGKHYIDERMPDYKPSPPAPKPISARYTDGTLVKFDEAQTSGTEYRLQPLPLNIEGIK